MSKLKIMQGLVLQYFLLKLVLRIKWKLMDLLQESCWKSLPRAIPQFICSLWILMKHKLTVCVRYLAAIFSLYILKSSLLSQWYRLEKVRFLIFRKSVQANWTGKAQRLEECVKKVIGLSLTWNIACFKCQTWFKLRL